MNLSLRRSTKNIKLSSVIFLLNALIIFLNSLEALYVIIPGLLCTDILVFSIIILWKWNKGVPFFDVGFFCILATYIYSIYPIVNYLVDGLQFGLLSDNRLRSHNITPFELGQFHYRHVVYIFFLSSFYILFRKKIIISTGKIKLPDFNSSRIILLFFLLLIIYFYLLKQIIGINYSSSYEPDAYNKNIGAFANAPLIVIQVSTKLAGIYFLFKLSTLFLLIAKCNIKKWRYILFFWLTIEVIDALILKGSRSSLMLFLLASVLLYHRLIKPFSARFLALSGIFLFLFFVFLGLYRTYLNLTSLQGSLSDSNAGIFSSGSEFQAILGTSYDVFEMRKSGVHFPLFLLFNDFITILPPQQLLPFEKIEASEWYLRQLGMNGTGVGFMWGVVSQALVGFDWIELIFRGIILGILLAKLHNFYGKYQSSFFITIFYVYMCLRVYYTFRDTTFSILAYIVWEIIPFYILLKLGELLLSNTKSVKSLKN